MTAVLYEDGKPIRAFKDDKCLYKAYCWAHRHFCLEDEVMPLHKLPDWLEVKLYMLTQEQFDSLVS